MTVSKSAKLARKRVTLPATPTQWDQGASGRANRVNLRQEPATDFNPETGKETANPNGVHRMRRLPWVAIYHAQGRLADAQLAAALMLHDLAHGVVSGDPLAALSIDCQPRGDVHAARIDARRRFAALYRKIPHSCRPVIERVVINNEPLWRFANGAARERHFARLRDGLQSIA